MPRETTSEERFNSDPHPGGNKGLYLLLAAIFLLTVSYPILKQAWQDYNAAYSEVKQDKMFRSRCEWNCELLYPAIQKYHRETVNIRWPRVSVANLISRGFLSPEVRCPDHGVYSFHPVSYDNGARSDILINCSLHGTLRLLRVNTVMPNPVQPETEVLISGDGFGDHAGSIFVLLDTTTTAEINHWSETAIRFRMPQCPPSADVHVIVKRADGFWSDSVPIRTTSK